MLEVFFFRIKRKLQKKKSCHLEFHFTQVTSRSQKFMKTYTIHRNAKVFKMNVAEQIIQLSTFLCFQILQTAVRNDFGRSESKMAA